jgi:hypothetical protein
VTEDKALGTLLIARGFEWGWQPWRMPRKLEQLPAEESQPQMIPQRRGSIHVFEVRDGVGRSPRS